MVRRVTRSTLRKLEIAAELYEMKIAERTRQTIARSRARCKRDRVGERVHSDLSIRADLQAKRLERLVVYYADTFAKEVLQG